eukprot:scaffold56008_cov65-Phaeocystis_antarctica.AAC.4
MLRSSLPGGVVSPRRRPGDGACAETDRSRHHYTHGLDAQGLFHGTTQEAAHRRRGRAGGRFWRFRGSFRDAERRGKRDNTWAAALYVQTSPLQQVPAQVGPVVSRLLECRRVRRGEVPRSEEGFWKSLRFEHAASI